MASLPTNFAALCLQAGIAVDTTHYLFMTTGQSGTLDLFVQTPTGSVRIFNANYRGLLNGSGTPSNSLGASGDYYIDDYNHKWFGPKPTNSAWGSGISFIGPTGATGATGASGSNGAPGTGILSGGRIFEVLGKATDDDYSTTWYNVFDILAFATNGQDPIQSYKKIYHGHLFDENGDAVTDIGSGVTYNPLTDTIFVLSDGSGSTPAIYEYSKDGRFLRVIALTGFYDIEAISFMIWDFNNVENRGAYFILAEERSSLSGTTSSLHQVLIDDTTTELVKGGPDHLIDYELVGLTKSSPNQGIEAMAYNPTDGMVYFCLQVPIGSDPWWIYKASMDLATFETAILIGGGGVGPGDVTEIRDMCWNAEQNGFMMIGFRGTPSNAVLIRMGINSVYNYADMDLDMLQPEGICLSVEDNMLFLVGENATDGADWVVLQRPRLTNPFLDESKKLKYYGGKNQYSVVGKQYHSLGRVTFTDSDGPKSIRSEDADGTYVLADGFNEHGNTLKITAYGSVEITEVSPGSCALQLSLANYIGLAQVGGVTGGFALSMDIGTHNWKYEAEITFRTGDYLACSTFEDYYATSGIYKKSISLASGVKPTDGNFDLGITSVEGGTATYTYVVDTYHVKLERS